MKHAVLTILLVACQDESAKKPPTPPVPPARAAQCTEALKSFDKFVDTGDPDATAEQRGAVKTAVHGRCVADHWSDAALACMTAAASSQTIFECWNKQLTPEQRKSASDALGALKQ